MGRWSAAVMGGDSAIDWHDIFTQDSYKDDVVAMHCEIKKSADESEIGVAYQVMGKVAMERGLYIPPSFKDTIIYHVNKEIQNDLLKWENPHERKYYLDDFISKLCSHEKGDRTLLKQEEDYDPR